MINSLTDFIASHIALITVITPSLNHSHLFQSVVIIVINATIAVTTSAIGLAFNIALRAVCAAVIALVTIPHDLTVVTIVLILEPMEIKPPIAVLRGPIASAIPAIVSTSVLPLSSRFENQFASLDRPSTALVTNGSKLSVIVPKAVLKLSFKEEILPSVV